MKGLDLSKFKKMASDKASTTLHHPDGHSIRIAHSGLLPKMREQLDKLPIHKAQGGEVRKYADGTPDEPVQPEDQSAPKESPPVVINVGTAAQAAPAPQGQQMPAQPPVAAPPAVQAPEQPQSAMEPGSEQAQPAEIPSNAPAQPPAAQPESQTLAPVAAVPQPVSAPVSPPAPAEPLPVDQEVLQQTKAWEQDLMNGHITPKQYSDLFADKNVPQKIGTLFGLLVGGAGAGLTHTANPVITMMNNEIQNDLEAQKQSKLNAQNYIRLNQSHQLNQAQIRKMVQEGQLTEAQASSTIAEANIKSFALAQSQMLQSSFHTLVSNVDKMPEGSQKEIAKQQLGIIYSKIGDKISDVANQAAGATEYYKTLFGQPGAGGSNEQDFQQKVRGMKALGPQGETQAKDLEEKHFPGLKGQATIPWTSEERNKMNSGIEFDQKLHRFMDWTKTHSGDLNPQDRNAGQALASELQGAYRQATAGGVYKEGEQNFISKLIDSTPTKFFNEVRVLPQLKAISGENQAKINQLAKSKGYEGYSSPSSQVKSAQEQQSNSEIKTMNGVQYKKVNNGWQVIK